VLAGLASATLAMEKPTTPPILPASLTPMITGTVIAVDEHSMTVNTGDDQHLTLHMDSRTLLPPDLAPGMAMKSEFKMMDNGDLYATRVIPIRNIEGADNERVLETGESESGTSNASLEGSGGGTDAQVADYVKSTESPSDVQEDRAEDAAEAKEEHEESLPQTASNQGALVLLGLIAIAGAGVVSLTRRRA